jgi:hypothetical protein
MKKHSVCVFVLMFACSGARAAEKHPFGIEDWGGLRGAAGERVPTYQGREYLLASAARGKAVRMVPYPGSPHFPKLWEQRRDLFSEIFAWLVRYNPSNRLNQTGLLTRPIQIGSCCAAAGGLASCDEPIHTN